MFADRRKPNPWSRSAPLPRDLWPVRPVTPRLSTGQAIKQTAKRTLYAMLLCIALLAAGMVLTPKIDQLDLARREWLRLSDTN